MGIFIFCDESGDTGCNGKGTRAYVATTVFVHSPKADPLRSSIREHKRSVLGLRHPAEWKNLSSTQKKDDAGIAEFLSRVTEIGGMMLGSTVMDKRHMTGEYLTIPQTQTLTPFAHGLVFKRTLPYISKYKLAQFYMDRNSSIPTQENLRRYLSREIPIQVRLDTTICPPSFLSPKDDYLLQFADFIAGTTRVMFEHYLDCLATARTAQPYIDWSQVSATDLPGFLYPHTYSVLSPFYAKQLPRWRWEALLYHPYEKKSDVNGFFPSLPDFVSQK